MNSKKANWLFAVIIGTFVVLRIILEFTNLRNYLGYTSSLLLSEGLIMIPAVVFLLVNERSVKESLGFRRFRLESLFLLIVYTILLVPMMSLANLISLYFVDSAMGDVMTQMGEHSFFLSFFLMAIVPPFCEEFVFRGMIFGNYRKSGSCWKAIFLSSFLFGIMHMNFNQAPYAFLIGIGICLAYEATDSIFAGMFMHFLINGQSCVLAYVQTKMYPEMAGEVMEQGQDELRTFFETPEVILPALVVLFLIAMAGVVLAACLIRFVAKLNGREQVIDHLFLGKCKNAERIVTVPLLVAIFVCIIYMVLDFI